jgi:hypothetical protein
MKYETIGKIVLNTGEEIGSVVRWTGYDTDDCISIDYDKAKLAGAKFHKPADKPAESFFDRQPNGGHNYDGGGW